MRSEASTVEEYLAELPEERATAISAVREAILARLPEGYEEAMNWGMISYEVPLSSYPHTYNGKPLMYAALASQKGHMAVYLSAIYADEEERARFEAAYRATGEALRRREVVRTLQEPRGPSPRRGRRCRRRRARRGLHRDVRAGPTAAARRVSPAGRLVGPGAPVYASRSAVPSGGSQS